MKKRSGSFVGKILVTGLIAFSFIPLSHIFADPPPGQTWTLIWNDEFDGTSLDLSKWGTTYPWGARTNNDEQEWYTDNSNLVSSSTLKLIANNQSVQTGYPYTSGMITSYGHFSQQYGYVEARMKLPAGRGLWPAFWLLPDSTAWPPEIDIMENLGNDPKTIYMTSHWSPSYPQQGTTGQDGGSVSTSYTGADFSAGFHTFGIAWSPTTMTWYVDGVQRFQTTSHVPLAGYGFNGFYILANLAVGGSWPGSPDGTTVFPSQLEIDYIRAYQSGTPDTVPPVTTISTPSDGSTVSGTINVTATATDDIGVTSMELLVDGIVVTTCPSLTPCTIPLDTTVVPNGPHTITVISYDAFNNQSADTRTVNVNNVPLPTCSLSISPNSILQGLSAILSWTSQNASSFYIDQGIGNVDTTADGSTSVSPATSTTYTGTVTDTNNDIVTCLTNLNILLPDTTPPTVSLSAPANGVNVSGTITVSATASDNVGVVGVKFLLDGVVIGNEDTTSPYSVSWNTTTATAGQHTLTAVARDAAGNTTTSAPRTVNVTTDSTPPTVSLSAPLNNATVSGSAVTISGTASDNVGVVGVQFKLDGNSIGAEDTTSPYSISWDSKQATNGAHALTAVARDAVGNKATSTSRTITVSNDTTPPTVSLSAPANNATVSGTATTISASASDNKGVAGVQFVLDGLNFGAEDTTSPYSVVWNTITSTNGPHTLTAIARDTSGNLTTSAPNTITVNNDSIAPTVSITLPNDGDLIIGSVAVSADASDNVGVVGVQFKLDGANLSSEDTTAPYSVVWDSTTASNGTHTITAVARDGAGNKTTTATTTVTVNNADITPPTISLTAPANNSTVSGVSTAVSATAADNVGVIGVQFMLDGVTLGAEDTSAPYSVSWNTKLTSNGSHTLTAVARDAAGNTKTSSNVVVTVNNDTTPPVVSITSPINNATVSGTINLNANATDDTAVLGVQFKIDGVNYSTEDTTSPYSKSLTTSTLTSGSHTLTAVARDGAGNTAESSPVTFIVSSPTSYYPSSYTVNTGAYQSGNTASLTSDDNNYLTIKSTTVGARQTNTDFKITGLPLSSSRLDYSVDLKSTASNTTTIMYAYNYTTGSWTQLSNSSISTLETTKTASISSGTSNYVNSAGESLIRVTSSQFSNHSISFEIVKLTSNP